MKKLSINKSITHRNSISVEKYLSDISKERLLTMEEETLLAIKIKEGDEDALNSLAKANLRFVVSVAKQYQNKGLSLSDLINEGNLGLIKAAKHFDVTKGFKFISYAVWWIRQSILQSIAKNARLIRLPLNQLGSLNKIKKETIKLEQKLGRKPSINEIADSLELSEKKVSALLKYVHKDRSIDDSITEEFKIIDVYVNKNSASADAKVIKESMSKEIQFVLSALPKREKDIINLYFGINGEVSHTLEEIGDVFNITRERVRQIKEKAINRLKYCNRSEVLRQYLNEE